jgi:hypothetical protein
VFKKGPRSPRLEGGTTGLECGIIAVAVAWISRKNTPWPGPMHVPRPLVVLGLVCLAAPSVAQTVAGRVVDAATGAPISGVIASLVGNGRTVVSQRSNDSGQFTLRPPTAGQFALTLRRLGFQPLTSAIRLDAGETQRPVFRLTQLPTSLDTVVTAGRTSLFNVTPGRVKYAEHMALNTGFFVSGLEIRRSKMTAIEYLGTLPGLRFSPSVPTPSLNSRDVTAPAVIPGANGFLLTEGGKCLVGRIDHWSIPYLLWQMDEPSVDAIVEVDDIMGVEVFAVSREIPKEWRVETVTPLVRHSGRLQPFLIGDTGVPRGPWLGAPIQIPRQYDLDLFWSPDSVVKLAGGRAPGPRTNSQPNCGFVQIWTRIAW